MSEEPTENAEIDPDTTELLDVLRGAARGPRDPDVELATILAELEITGDAEHLLLALTRLVRDEDTD